MACRFLTLLLSWACHFLTRLLFDSVAFLTLSNVFLLRTFFGQKLSFFLFYFFSHFFSFFNESFIVGHVTNFLILGLFGKCLSVTSSYLKKIDQKWRFYKKTFPLLSNNILYKYINIYITEFNIYIPKLFFIPNNSNLWNLFITFLLFCRSLSQ